MAAVGRESRFMPTVKCSTCGLQVEISLMGEHVCEGSGSPAAEATPPMPANSIFGRLMPNFGNPIAQKQQPRAPPQVDTSAANRAFMGQGELTPSSESQSSISPETPSALRPGLGKQDEHFAPRIANNSPPPPRTTRPGGYGGLEDIGGNEDAPPPKKQPPNLMERLQPMSYGPGRRPSAPEPRTRNDSDDRPGTSSSMLSSSLGSGRRPSAPRHNGYGGFGPPAKPPGSADGAPTTPNRSETFPRPSDRFAPPTRTPSAPSPSRPPRPDRLQSPLDAPEDPRGRVPMTSDRARRPSRGPDTSRPPPPRTGVVRPKTPVVPTINLAEEFGVGNPYHNSSESTSSNGSESSSRPERRPSQASQSSSQTSPPRSLSSRSGRNPSDTSSFDNLMSDLQSTMDDVKPKPPALSPLKVPPRDGYANLKSPLSARPPRSGDRGYDPRIDPAVQNPRAPRGRSPMPSPMPNTPLLDDGLTVQTPSDMLSPSTPGLPPPRFTSSPERMPDAPQQQQQQSRLPPQDPRQRSPQDPRQRPPQDPRRRPSRAPNPELEPLSPDLLQQPQPQQEDQPPLPRDRSASLYPPSSRGNCKACALPIKGKSISSADGRLTGRYHKPCFVCTACSEPFTSSTFYVLDDAPYCERDYHRLNGSLCGSCGRGIEGQYLEDAGGVKHHVGCFKCGECGMALRDGYFEVGGRAYCEKDAWRLVQRGGSGNGGMGGMGMGMGSGGMGSGLRPPGMGMGMGLPGAPRAGPGPSRLGPVGGRPRMEKRMTRLGMM